MRLDLTIAGVVLQFTQPTAGGEYPWLAKVGTLTLAARAGHLEGVGVGEAANVSIELDNSGKQAATLLGFPMRARADLYDDDDELLLTGLVASANYGRVLVLGIEA